MTDGELVTKLVDWRTEMNEEHVHSNETENEERVHSNETEISACQSQEAKPFAHVCSVQSWHGGDCLVHEPRFLVEELPYGETR